MKIVGRIIKWRHNEPPFLRVNSVTDKAKGQIKRTYSFSYVRGEVRPGGIAWQTQRRIGPAALRWDLRSRVMKEEING